MPAKTPPIKTLPEAREELGRVAESVTRLQEFVTHFSGVMDQLNEMRGLVAPAQLHFGGGVDTKFEAVAHMPFTQRVFIIIKEAEGPITQKDAAAEYERRAWPLPKGPLLKAVNGAFHYLFKRAETIVRMSDGYIVGPTSSQSAA